MNPEVKKAWVEALRSGKYPQAKGQLHNGEGYCCYGVLCELAVEAGIVENRQYNPDAELCWYDSVFSMPPVSVTSWAGFSPDFPEVSVPESPRTGLQNLNDECDYDFDQIADVIEHQL